MRLSRLLVLLVTILPSCAVAPQPTAFDLTPYIEAHYDAVFGLTH